LQAVSIGFNTTQSNHFRPPRAAGFDRRQQGPARVIIADSG